MAFRAYVCLENYILENTYCNCVFSWDISSFSLRICLLKAHICSISLFILCYDHCGILRLLGVRWGSRQLRLFQLCFVLCLPIYLVNIPRRLASLQEQGCATNVNFEQKMNVVALLWACKGLENAHFYLRAGLGEYSHQWLHWQFSCSECTNWKFRSCCMKIKASVRNTAFLQIMADMPVWHIIYQHMLCLM